MTQLKSLTGFKTLPGSSTVTVWELWCSVVCVFKCSISSDVIRAFGGSRAPMLVLEERSDCRSVVASLFLPLSRTMINTSRMEEDGAKTEGRWEGRVGIRLTLNASVFLLRVLYSFLMCDLSVQTA